MPPKSVPLTAPQRSRPPGAGSGSQGVLCLEHGAPLCPKCRSLGWGISRYCRARHQGHAGPEVGPWCPAAGPRCPTAPPRVAPGRHVLVPQDRRAGAAALSSSAGRAPPPKPSQPRAPRRLAGARPPKALGAHPPSALGPGDSRSPKRPRPDLPADQGGAVSVGPAEPGGGDADPFYPPPTAGDSSGPAPMSAHPDADPPRAPPVLQDSSAPPSPPPVQRNPPPPLQSNPPPPAGG